MMPRIKKSTKRKIRAAFHKAVRVAFAFLILYMAGLTLSDGVSTSFFESQQEGEEQTAFIHQVAPVSQKMQELHGMRASISIAQAILESDWGKSELATEYHNLFGVKGSNSEQSALLETQEFVEGEWLTIQAYFKVYPNYAASIEDHTRLMVEGVTWNPTLYHPVLAADTYQEAAYALQEAGYATDPTYPAKIIDIIETYELYKFDLPVPQPE